MNCVEWSDKFLLGDPTVDLQHQRLFAAANDVAAALYAGASREAWRQATAALLDHTADHFRFEESVMRQVAYPGTAAHQAQHDELLGQLHGFCTQAGLARGPASERGHRSIVFLRRWLVHHLALTDRSMIDWLRGRPGLPRTG